MRINLVTNPNFAGNSVRIVGTRTPAADHKYPCLNSIDICFALDADGALFHVIEDLCPSENIPKGDWTFTYEIYSDANCQAGPGELMNAPGNPNNFVCYAIDDIFAQAHANYSIETLEAGVCNENKIVCLTKTADKTFDFNVCVEVDDPCEADPSLAGCPPAPPNGNEVDILRLDCGCVPNVYHPEICDCPQSLDGLPPECTVLPANECLVVCGEPAKVAAARFRSFDAISAIQDDIFLGIGDVGVGANRVQTGFQWAPVNTMVFTSPVFFTYVPGVELQVDVGDPSVKTLEYPLAGDLGPMDSFKVTIAARGCEKVELLDLTLDGTDFGDFEALAGTVADYDFSTTLLNDGFTFEGTLRLTNCDATQENSKVEILVGRNTAALF